MGIQDTYNWVIKVIDSCENFFQLRSCRNLIDNFYKVYPEDKLFKKLNYKYENIQYNFINPKKDW